METTDWITTRDNPRKENIQRILRIPITILWTRQCSENRWHHCIQRHHQLPSVHHMFPIRPHIPHRQKTLHHCVAGHDAQNRHCLTKHLIKWLENQTEYKGTQGRGIDHVQEHSRGDTDWEDNIVEEWPGV